MAVNFLPPRVPICDPRTGLATREFYIFLQSLFNLGGISDEFISTVAPPISADALSALVDRARDDAALSQTTQIVAAPQDDLAPPPQPLFFAADDVLPVIGALRDEVATLRRELERVLIGGPVL